MRNLFFNPHTGIITDDEGRTLTLGQARELYEQEKAASYDAPFRRLVLNNWSIKYTQDVFRNWPYRKGV